MAFVNLKRKRKGNHRTRDHRKEHDEFEFTDNDDREEETEHRFLMGGGGVLANLPEFNDMDPISTDDGGQGNSNHNKKHRRHRNRQQRQLKDDNNGRATTATTRVPRPARPLADTQLSPSDHGPSPMTLSSSSLAKENQQGRSRQNRRRIQQLKEQPRYTPKEQPRYTRETTSSSLRRKHEARGERTKKGLDSLRRKGKEYSSTMLPDGCTTDLTHDNNASKRAKGGSRGYVAHKEQQQQGSSSRRRQGPAEKNQKASSDTGLATRQEYKFIVDENGEDEDDYHTQSSSAFAEVGNSQAEPPKGSDRRYGMKFNGGGRFSLYTNNDTGEEIYDSGSEADNDEHHTTTPGNDKEKRLAIHGVLDIQTTKKASRSKSTRSADTGNDEDHTPPGREKKEKRREVSSSDIQTSSSTEKASRSKSTASSSKYAPRSGDWLTTRNSSASKSKQNHRESSTQPMDHNNKRAKHHSDNTLSDTPKAKGRDERKPEHQPFESAKKTSDTRAASRTRARTTKSQTNGKKDGNMFSLAPGRTNARKKPNSCSKTRPKPATVIDPGSTFGGSPQQEKSVRPNGSGTKKRKPAPDASEPDSASKLATRSSKRTRRKRQSEEVVDLMSDEEEHLDDTCSKQDDVLSAVHVRKEVDRISLGKMILCEDCSVELRDQTLEIFGGKKYSSDGKLMAKIDVQKELNFLKFFLGGEETKEMFDGSETFLPSFLSLHVARSKGNMLSNYKNSYDQEAVDDKKKYVVIQFRSDDDLNLFLNGLATIDESFDVENSKLSKNNAKEYCATLRTGRNGFRRSKATDAVVGNRSEDDVLLVYPFAGDIVAIEGAAADLTEAKGDLFSENSPATASSPVEGEGNVPPEAADVRRHKLTVQVRDVERLNPGEFLNDTLIDFWIQWITRKADQDPLASKVHCFTSHFFTTLAEEGVDGVKRWTARRKINILEKKFVFIPINEALHWSLCIVVNPGAIEADTKDDEAPMPCMIFLDSLKAHKKSKVSKLVRQWLGSEWRRVKGEEDVRVNPFGDKQDFPLLDPKIPYQNNTWDCGVFVCRYAYSMYSLRGESFTRGDQWFAKDLMNLDTNHFKFNMEDIARLRREILALVGNLSEIYLPWKKEQDEKEKQARKARASRRGSAVDSKDTKRDSNAAVSAEADLQQPDRDTTPAASDEDHGSMPVPDDPAAEVVTESSRSPDALAEENSDGLLEARTGNAANSEETIYLTSVTVATGMEERLHGPPSSINVEERRASIGQHPGSLIASQTADDNGTDFAETEYTDAVSLATQPQRPEGHSTNESDAFAAEAHPGQQFSNDFNVHTMKQAPVPHSRATADSQNRREENDEHGSGDENEVDLFPGSDAWHADETEKENSSSHDMAQFTTRGASLRTAARTRSSNESSDENGSEKEDQLLEADNSVERSGADCGNEFVHSTSKPRSPGKLTKEEGESQVDEV